MPRERKPPKRQPKTERFTPFNGSGTVPDLLQPVNRSGTLQRLHNIVAGGGWRPKDSGAQRFRRETVRALSMSLTAHRNGASDRDAGEGHRSVGTGSNTIH